MPDPRLAINGYLSGVYGVVAALRAMENGFREVIREDPPDVEGIGFILGCLCQRLEQDADGIMEIAG